MGYYSKIYNSGLPHRARSVYIYLYDKSIFDDDRRCYPAIGTIARELNISRSTVKRALGDLERAGWISKERRSRENGGNSSNYYYILGIK